MRNFTLFSMTFTALSGILMPDRAMAVVPAGDGAVPSQKKNVLMIAVDDLKPLLGCYGDPIARTPHIDNLAEQGTLFASAYCQQAVSAATRASLLTGWCPDRTHVWDLKTLIRSQNPDVVTLPQYFIGNGYTVAGIGKIYDPRSVDKGNDKRSWSQPYMDYEKFLSKEHGLPVMAQYQGKGTRELYNKYRKEAKEKGLTKKNEIEKYIQQFIKPTTECAAVPDNAYTDGAVADGAVKFLNEYHSGQPFFLAVGFKNRTFLFALRKSIGNCTIVKRCHWPLSVSEPSTVRHLLIIIAVNCSLTATYLH